MPWNVHLLKTRSCKISMSLRLVPVILPEADTFVIWSWWNLEFLGPELNLEVDSCTPDPLNKKKKKYFATRQAQNKKKVFGTRQAQNKKKKYFAKRQAQNKNKKYLARDKPKIKIEVWCQAASPK